MNFFLECSQEQAQSEGHMLIYSYLKYFQRYELFSPFLIKSRLQTDRLQQTESDTYEPTAQNAQVGSKIMLVVTGGQTDTQKESPTIIMDANPKNLIILSIL